MAQVRGVLMSKKKNQPAQTGRQEEGEKSNNTFYIAMAVVLIFAVGGGFPLWKVEQDISIKTDSWEGRTRGRLVQRSRRRCFWQDIKCYKVAQEIPEVLDSLFAIVIVSRILGIESADLLCG